MEKRERTNAMKELEIGGLDTPQKKAEAEAILQKFGYESDEERNKINRYLPEHKFLKLCKDGFFRFYLETPNKPITLDDLRDMLPKEALTTPISPIEKRLELIKETLTIKAKEYVRNNDEFHNFNEGAKITGQSPLRVLDGFLLKHLISYRDMLDDIDEGKLPTREHIEEKLGDIINYFILQEAQLYKTISDENNI